MILKRITAAALTAALLASCASAVFETRRAAVNHDSDPAASLQWYLNDAGLTLAQERGYDGTGVTVAVIDSGCRLTHEDLQSMRVTDTADFVSGGSNVEDTVKHGTGVIGILAAGARNGVGMTGLAPNADYIILRAFSENGGDDGALVSAIRYAVDAGADVINLSVGNSGEKHREKLQPVIDEANEKGCIIVAAVGNSGTSDMLYPAGCSGVIGVGAYGKNGERSSRSNTNSSVDILAPGEGIYTLSAARDNTYTTVSGTSFAAPVVTAMAAWAKQADESTDGEAFLGLLRKTARSVGADVFINGNGLINALNNGEGVRPSASFSNASESVPLVSSVLRAYESGLLCGTENGLFSPRAFLTRGMLVSIFYRAEAEDMLCAYDRFCSK